MVDSNLRYRSGSHARRAIWAGLALNGLFVLVFVWGLHGPQTATAASSAGHEQRGSAAAPAPEQAAGWVGQIKLPVGTIIVESSEDRGEAARRLLGGLSTPCSILKISVSLRGPDGPITIEPSSLRLLSTQGTIEALTADDVLPMPGRDAEGLARYFGQAPVVVPVEMPRVAESLFPRGIDMRQVGAITLRVNGQPVTVPGRVVSSQDN